ncbi:2-polyprenyl-6-methoxyphenol hydroxylase-like FAD-dependent oxidoreductase [Prauserella sediminis]|uniref:2-polyprenyl-6-methoxyphenol hydroxylase-like FAD-dependent oxidoreductase n=1 Tax=Prauserella sediminis TaxID=577680 RepID=A0A839XCH1_9PSEU|nr:NAD(P)/FAD-dependent oxidoreductase [Prauserella sediminis]MBB3661662.1 2-polyprenyl-6-methoxyphenol hydroxylase-like FAD-dependent oxidoreductase [Prauserella sediminis]
MKILIVGGGIAGSTLGYALRNAGLDASVIEVRSDLDDTGGAFLTLAPNGINALRAIGLGDVPEASGGFELTGLDFHNARGRRIAELAGEGDLRVYGARSVVVRRARLHAALASRARESGAEFLFDARLVALRPLPEGWRGVLDDGRTVDADVVIGADGIWSTVRRLIWSDAPAPSYTGVVDCGGWAKVDLPDSDRQQMHFGHQAFFGYAVKNAMAYWFTNVPREDTPGRSELDELDQDAWMATIRRLHARDPEPVRAVLAAAHGSLGAWPVYDMPELDAWNTATVCLIGDAAHAVSPSSGQGASLAIEDAVTLAAYLRDERGADAAFTCFVRERKERAEKIVRFGRRIGDRKISSTAGNLFRDLTLAMFLRMGAKSTKEQYRYRVPTQPEPPTTITPGAENA